MLVVMGLLLLCTHRITGISIIVGSVVIGVAAGMSLRDVGVVTLDRAAGVIGIHIEPMIGLKPDPILLPFSEVDRIGLVLFHIDGPAWITLELTTQDGTRYTVDVSSEAQPGGMVFSEALRDHMAHAAHIEHIEPIHQRWRVETPGNSTPKTPE